MFDFNLSLAATHKFRRNTRKSQLFAPLNHLSKKKSNFALFVLRWCSYCNPMPITHALKSFDLATVCSTFRTNKTSHVLLVHFMSSGHAKYGNEKLHQQSVGLFYHEWLINTGKLCIAHKKLTSSLVFAAK